MGTLNLVRHGQASFGAADYDNLSDLGQRQSQRLGEYFGANRKHFDAVLTGTLRRHAQTWQGIASGMQLAAADAPAVHVWPGLDEYDPAALIGAVHRQKLEMPKTPEDMRNHFRLLREGLLAWMAGETKPVRMPTYAEFKAGVISALDHVREQYPDGDVLIVSSGGPISTAVGHVLGAGAEATVELNLRIRNCSLSQFSYNAKKHSLMTYNMLPHLESPEHQSWITYA
ncbi:MAG TPA: histidine phosphatase family protein [Casimicrobium sp.]|nr:histidine phosphatase family protein [Casimicrobium sp.]